MNSELHTNRSSTIGLCNDFKIEKWPTLMLFQTCMTYFSLLNTKEDIWTAVTFILWTKNTLQYNSSWVIQTVILVWNELMNEWCIYVALYCVLLYTKSALQSCGGGVEGGGGGLSFTTTTSVQHPPWWDGCHRTTAPVRSPHSYRWRGERVIEPIKWMGIIRRPWLTRASGGNLARTPGLHPFSLREVPWDF